jgi:predicted alpha/beta hydrolase family esterase
MKNAIILHGWVQAWEYYDDKYPTASNSHWIPWLSKQLQIKGYKADAPEMTQHNETTYESWKREFERFDLTTDTLLVGHSLGGGFIVRYLSENDVKVGKVILVAPWMGIKSDDAVDTFNDDFFNFTLDRTIASKTADIHIIYSNDDFQSIHESISILRESLDDVKFIELQNKGHFTRESLGTEVFPELLEVCIQP